MSHVGKFNNTLLVLRNLKFKEKLATQLVKDLRILYSFVISSTIFFLHHVIDIITFNNVPSIVINAKI